MKKLSKTVLIALIVLATSSVFASKVKIKLTEEILGDVFNWLFKTANDGMFFLLGPESTNALVIHVNKTVASGKISDPVMVYCNATSYRVETDSSLTCYGNFNDVIFMSIAPNDVKNGSEGTYTYVPVIGSKYKS